MATVSVDPGSDARLDLEDHCLLPEDVEMGSQFVDQCNLDEVGPVA